MQVDSRQQKLNIGEIITIFLQNNPQQYPADVALPAIIKELSEPNVQTKQFGNTVFEVIGGDGDKAFFKAFNADTGPNFVENGKLFVVWAKRVLGLKVLVTEFDDPRIEQVFKAISIRPPMPGLGYQVFKSQSGKTRIGLNLGE